MQFTKNKSKTWAMERKKLLLGSDLAIEGVKVVSWCVSCVFFLIITLSWFAISKNKLITQQVHSCPTGWDWGPKLPHLLQLCVHWGIDDEHCCRFKIPVSHHQDKPIFSIYFLWYISFNSMSMCCFLLISSISYSQCCIYRLSCFLHCLQIICTTMVVLSISLCDIVVPNFAGSFELVFAQFLPDRYTSTRNVTHKESHRGRRALTLMPKPVGHAIR